MADNPFAGLRSLLLEGQAPAAPGPQPSNPGTIYEGRAFGTRERGPQPSRVTDRPDLNAPPAPPAAPPGSSSQFGRGFQTGMAGMAELNWSVVAALGQVFGAETVQKWGLENAEAAQQRARETLPRIAKIEDIGGPRDFVDWTLGTLGQLAPFALESAATAIAGAVVGAAVAGPAGAGAGALAGAGRSAAVKEAIKAAAKGNATAAQQQVARQAMAKLGANVGVVASGYKTGFGDVYNETVEGGDPSPGLAAIAAAPYAALDALPELVLVNQISKLFGREGARELARSIVQRVGIGAVKQALLEGGAEGSQEALLILARKAVEPGYDPTGAETKSRLANAAAAGAIGGATIGGATAAFDTGAPVPPAGTAAPGTVPPGGTPPADVPLDTLEAQPPTPPAAGMPTFGGATPTATSSPLMPAGQAAPQAAPPLESAGNPPPLTVEPAAPAVEPVEPPVAAGLPTFGGATPTATAAPLMPAGQPEVPAAPVEAAPAAGLPTARTELDDAASLLGDADAASAMADLGAILQPETPPAATPVEPAAPVVEKPAKKAKKTKAQRKAAYKGANQFKSFLSEFGVRADLKLDILGDKKAPNPPVPFGKGPIFRKNGMNLDELASYAMQAGFITEQQMNDPSDNGATRLLADMIRRQMNGEGNLQTIEGLEAEIEARTDPNVEGLMLEAQRRGIPTEGRSPLEVDEDLRRADARDLGVDPDGMSLEEVADAVEQAEVNRLLAEAAEGGGETLLNALAVDPDGRIALAMLADDGAVERASRNAEDDVDFLNRIEDIIRGSGRTDANAADDSGDRDSRPRGSGSVANGTRAGPGAGAGGATASAATASDNAGGARGDRAGGAQESGVSSGGRESGETEPDAAGTGDQRSGEDADGADQGERGRTQPNRPRGGTPDGVDQGRDRVGTAPIEGDEISARVRSEIAKLAGARDDAPAAGGDRQGEAAESLTLKGETPAELKAKAEAEAKVKAELEAVERKTRKKEKKADDAKSDRRQADATVDDFQLGQDAETQLRGPDLFDPLANNYQALAGATVVQTVRLDNGKDATLKMDAAQALRNMDDRIASLKALQTCLAGRK